MISRLRQGAAVLLLLLSVPSLALQSDSSQDVELSADGNSTMQISGNIRTVTMLDNVRVTQGSMVITGNNAVVEYRVDSGELTRVTIHGTPVQYEQQVNDAGEVVKGYGETIIFFTDELGDTILQINGNAAIESPDFIMQCQAITYIFEQDLIREATGPCSGTLSR